VGGSETSGDGTKTPLQYAQTAMDATSRRGSADAASHEVVVWLKRALIYATSVGDQDAARRWEFSQAIDWVQNTQEPRTRAHTSFCSKPSTTTSAFAGRQKAAIMRIWNQC